MRRTSVCRIRSRFPVTRAQGCPEARDDPGVPLDSAHQCQGLALPHLDPASRDAIGAYLILLLRFRAGNLGRYPAIAITLPAASPLNENKILVLPLAHNHCQHCEAIRPLDEGNSSKRLPGTPTPTIARYHRYLKSPRERYRARCSQETAWLAEYPGLRRRPLPQVSPYPSCFSLSRCA